MSILVRIFYRCFLVTVSAVFLLMDFFPRMKSADFRYTGCDDGRLVLNLGYPLAQFIHDPEVSDDLILNPLSLYVIAVQIAMLAALIAAPEMLSVIARKIWK